MTDDLARPGQAPADRCPLCGTAFTCGMRAGLSECWCARRPPLRRVPDASSGCYCPACLERLAAEPDPAGRC